MTTTEKKAPAAAKKPAATARKAPAKKAPAAKATAPKSAPVNKAPAAKAAPESQAKPAPKAAPKPAPVAKTADEKPVAPVPAAAPAKAEAEPTLQAYEAKIELLSSQIQEGYNEMFEFGKEQMENFFKFDNSDAFKSVEGMMAFSKDNMDAFVKSSSIAAKGVQDVATLVADITKTSIEENVAATQKLFECKTPQEAAELQTELMKSGYEKMMANATRISEASSKIAEEAAKPLQARVEAGVEKVKETAA